MVRASTTKTACPPENSPLYGSNGFTYLWCVKDGEVQTTALQTPKTVQQLPRAYCDHVCVYNHSETVVVTDMQTVTDASWLFYGLVKYRLLCLRAKRAECLRNVALLE